MLIYLQLTACDWPTTLYSAVAILAIFNRICNIDKLAGKVRQQDRYILNIYVLQLIQIINADEVFGRS